MRLAYSISGYKLPNQFRWLIDALWHPDDIFAIHIDARTSKSVFLAMQKVVNNRPNVFFIKREPIIWMGMGLVRAEMTAIARLLEIKPTFDYLINLSMQDYPIKSRHEIITSLEQNLGQNYIRMLALKDQPIAIRRRPSLMSFEVGDRLLKTPLPRFIPKDIHINFKGSWWRVISAEFCQWLVSSAETEKYMAFLKNVQTPDEFFFQNLIMASPYKDTLSGDYRHIIFWSGKTGSPDTITMAHMDEIKQSNMWFTRKVDETVDPVLLENLAQRIGAPIYDQEMGIA